ncbi:MAG: YbhB/YbcL family Raf kinase inhibitor-like protein [Candidatus Heimdallarchaeota archaeon]|nr:YbhB/YbcL family Raf kinase inhibitor-like protein [Candidatus Heimdallarchaeota archaeon]
MGKLTLTSPAFEDMGFIPEKYTCKGEEINPPLEISGVPQNAKSLVLIMEDPDIPLIFFFLSSAIHWVICHLDPNTKKIEEGSTLDDAIVGKNTMRQNKYMAPCPPWGTHRYIFKLFALDEKLSLTSKSRKKHVMKAMEGHILDQTELIGLYGKQ